MITGKFNESLKAFLEDLHAWYGTDPQHGPKIASAVHLAQAFFATNPNTDMPMIEFITRINGRWDLITRKDPELFLSHQNEALELLNVDLGRMYTTAPHARQKKLWEHLQTLSLLASAWGGESQALHGASGEPATMPSGAPMPGAGGIENLMDTTQAALNDILADSQGQLAHVPGGQRLLGEVQQALAAVNSDDPNALASIHGALNDPSSAMGGAMQHLRNNNGHMSHQ